MSKKQIILSVFLLFTLFIIWYFGFKKSDYVITFKEKAATGTVFQGILEWTATRQKKQGEVYVIKERNNFDFIKQEMTYNGKTLEYTWELTSLNDTLTAISVGISDQEHSFYNKLTAPFLDTPFKVEQVTKIKELKQGLEEHLKNFKVKFDYEGKSEEVFVAYIHLESVLQEKAQTMIGNDAIITGYLHQNNIKIIGKPYLEIEKWDLDKETLSFNYCFPIDKNSPYIENKAVKFKKIPSIKGLKATYYGNYRTSDRGWFAILDYAKKNNIKLDLKPIEHFMNNPFNGGQEIEWQTHILIPFAK